MLCCAVGVAAVATGAIGWRRFRRFFPERLNAQSLLAAAVTATIVLSITALTVEHFSHHAAYASDSTALLRDLGSLPLCRSGTPADRITDLASIEE
ncbi:hypothetical protein [Dongia deserti]|uniref:hypothetical protein n=1 Tax=Dongia deserti TaxID=2268030 RepID=UPI0013C4D543|nr:hypothetical protein [Dongia deserti]